ncbi:MAG: hypothetical protein OR996_00120 [Phycisphaerales bacterium]|nr:hypothetical protein [Phycisphaerales bacterium]
MHLLFEHHWLATSLVASIAFVLLWKSIVDGRGEFFRYGVAVCILSIVTFLIGYYVVTPVEHGRILVSGLVVAVEANDSDVLLTILDKNVEMPNQWPGIDSSGAVGAVASMRAFHTRHTLQFNTVLRIIPVEFKNRVELDVSMLSRVSRIGTVPSRWRITVAPNETGNWSITSIDVLEIMGRMYP